MHVHVHVHVCVCVCMCKPAVDEEGGVLCGVSFVHLPAWREDNTIAQTVGQSAHHPIKKTIYYYYYY